MVQQYPSALLEKAVGEFAKLPGIGRKTALRLVLHMLRQSDEMVDGFAGAVVKLKFVLYAAMLVGMPLRCVWWKTYRM